MPYFRVDVRIANYDERYIKAKNKKEAEEKAKKEMDSFCDSISTSAEKISKERFEAATEDYD